jgi:hypothetical protein
MGIYNILSVICLTTFALPIVLPFMTLALDRIQPYLTPSLIASYHDTPLPFSLGKPSTSPS